MKQKQSIVRIMMALAIAFGVQTTSNAQFGGLKKLAKKAIEKTTTSEESSSTSTTSSGNGSYSPAIKNARGEKYGQESGKFKTEDKGTKKGLTADGGVTITDMKYKRLLGTYYPNERKFVNGRGDAVIIAEDGTAKWNDGTDAGKITDKGFSTNGIKWMEYNAAVDQYQHEGVKVGEIKDENGGNIVTLFQKNWMETSYPVDHKILAFITYGMSFNDEILKQQYEQASAEQAFLSDPRPGDAMDREWLENSSKKHELREGDVWEDVIGEVHFNKRAVATWEEQRENGWLADRQMRWIGSYRNGSIYGRTRGLLGSIRANGDAVNAAGVKVGSLKNGVLYDKKGKKCGVVRGEDPKLCACFAFFMFGKL